MKRSTEARRGTVSKIKTWLYSPGKEWTSRSNQRNQRCSESIRRIFGSCHLSAPHLSAPHLSAPSKYFGGSFGWDRLKEAALKVECRQHQVGDQSRPPHSLQIRPDPV